MAHGNYKKEEGSKGKLVEEEERKAGRVQLSVVLRYLYVSPYTTKRLQLCHRAGMFGICMKIVHAWHLSVVGRRRDRRPACWCC